MIRISPFAALSDAIATTAAGGAPLVAGLEWGGRHHISALIWGGEVLVTSAQSLPEAEGYTAVLPGGGRVAALLAGRDPSSNLAVLRLGQPAQPPATTADAAGVGALVLALGSDGAGGISVGMGGIETLGPAWESQHGGRIDCLIRLGLRLEDAAEGGPVIDAAGRLLGMSTFGPRHRVLVIPAATIARVLPHLLREGRIRRGWLGVGLHPVMLPHDLAARAGAGHGLMVVSITAGAPTEGMLLPGDILLAIGETAVATRRSVAAVLEPERIGEVVTLRLLRGGMPAEASVTIAARPA